MRSYGNGKLNNRIYSVLLISLLVFIFSVQACIGSFAADGYTDVSIPYSHTYNAGGNRTGDYFTYRIKPVGNAPLPQGSENGAYDFKVKGVPGSKPQEGTIDLRIPFAQKGEYSYTVSAYVPNAEKGFTYDNSTYTVRVYVKSGEGNALTASHVIILGSDDTKRASLKFSPKHEAETLPPEEVRPTTTPAGDGTHNGGTVVAPANGGAGNPQDAAADDNAEPLTEKIGDGEVPKAFRESENWALLNLIAMILTVLIGGELLRRYFERVDTEDDEYIVRREGGLRLGGIIPAAVSVAIEAITQDFTKPMVLVDERTWLMVLLLVVEVAVAAAVFIRYDRESSYDPLY